MRSPALTVAGQLIQREFQPCLAAYLAGSVVRGEETDTSDLDLVIVREQGLVYRESRTYSDWPIELFVHTPDSLRQFFASDCRRRQPSLPQMCAEGIILYQIANWAEVFKQEAQSLLKQGPSPLSSEELETGRYQLRDLRDDLAGALSTMESYCIAQKLVPQAIGFYLHSQKAWSGEGKWLWRSLQKFSPPTAETWQKVILDFYQNGNKTTLLREIDQLLKTTGGYCFEGYYRPAD